MQPVKLSLVLGLALLATPVFADDNLLWKAVNNDPAQVVPAYAGQGSPFPVPVAPKVEDVSQSEAVLEQNRLKDEAYAFAQGILKGGSALRPELRTIRVGGVLVGNLGPRVLLNNQWVGVGEKIAVRQVKSTEIVNALKALAEYDAMAAEELGSNLSTSLASQPVATLTVRTITSTSLVLEGPQGRTTLAIPVLQ